MQAELAQFRQRLEQAYPEGQPIKFAQAMDTKLSHLDEYKMLFEENRMCQQEIHRAWLWAICPAGAIYTWLLSRNFHAYAHLPRLVWFIAPVIISVCALRYFGFWLRVFETKNYLLLLEEDAFGNCTTPLTGYVHFINKSPKKWFSLLKSILKDPNHRFPFIIAFITWFVLVMGSFYLSFVLSQNYFE
jgi:hypothetical protein